MIKYKVNILVNIKIFFQTLKLKQWLDKEKYFYNLYFKVFKKKINIKNLILDIKDGLNKYSELIGQDDYVVYFTYFGTYGSYELPNKVYIYIDRNSNEIVETVIHEIAHLKVEDQVQKQNLSHYEKEKLVEDFLRIQKK